MSEANNVLLFPKSNKLPPFQSPAHIEDFLKSLGFKNFIICGLTGEHTFTISADSEMARERAVFLLERAKLIILGGIDL